jgi:hypothetical protein
MKISRIQRLGVLFLCLRLAMPLGLRVGYLFQLCTRVCNFSCGRRWDHDEAKRVSQAKQRLNLCQFLLMRWCGDGSKPVCFSISSRLCIYIIYIYIYIYHNYLIMLVVSALSPLYLWQTPPWIQWIGAGFTISEANAPRRYVSLVSRNGTEGLADLQAQMWRLMAFGIMWGPHWIANLVRL